MDTYAKIERSLREISRDIAETNLRLQMMEDSNKEYYKKAEENYKK